MLKRLRVGAVFFGTPHRTRHAGDTNPLVKTGSIATPIAEIAGLKTKNNISETLKQGSFFNDFLNEKWLSHFKDVQLISYTKVDGAVSFLWWPYITSPLIEISF